MTKMYKNDFDDSGKTTYYHKIINKVVEILKANPKGLPYSELIKILNKEFEHEIPNNTIVGTFSVYFDKFPEQIIRHKRGFYKYHEKNTQKDNDFKDVEINTLNGKITYLNIVKWHQFKDAEFFFTYPLGHKKFGQPVDKICIIGQSGTGKTSILNLFEYFSLSNDSKINIKPLDFDINDEIIIQYQTTQKQNVTLHLKKGKIEVETDTENIAEIQKVIAEQKRKRLIYFPIDVNIIKKEEMDESNAKNALILNEEDILDFSYLTPTDYYQQIALDINEYINNFIIESNRIARKLLNSSDANEVVHELKNWKENNKNPLQLLAEKHLDSLLKQFGVRLATEFDAQVNSKNFIDLISLTNGKTIKMQNWSSGTKQLILRALPLYQIEPKDSVILIDEPENSLYPDIQRQVVNFYTLFGVDSQFFFATHSPLICSSFEPCEVFELVFDADNTVKPKQNYEGYRHVDNYFHDPRLLKWDSILNRFFGVEVEGNELRKDTLKEYAKLNVKINKLLEKKGNENEIQKMINEKLALAKKLDWKTENTYEKN